MLRHLLPAFLITICAAGHASVSFFPLDSVRLDKSQFSHAMDMDKCYIMGLDPDRLLAPYLKEAGLQPKADNYPNWESTGLDGHIGGHYLSALSYLYASTGDEETGRRLDYMLSELKRCQDAAGDGYLSGIPGGRATFADISQGKIKAGRFDLNGKWVPFYNIHKIYAGLRDAYFVGGRQQARDMLIALTDWMIGITSKLEDKQIQTILESEHGGLNEVFADVAAITGDDKYLQLAERFSDISVLNPLASGNDKLTGLHANTQIPKIIGFERIAEVGGDKKYHGAACLFWNTVVGNRSVTIGGNSVREHFHPSDDFSSMLTSEQGPETCNTYNMLRLTKMLYSDNPADSCYMDYYERALYNHILSSQDPEQGGFVYFTPMRQGHYRVYSQPQTSFWCCVGSGMENHAKYGEMIYAEMGDTLLVNLYIPSTLHHPKAKVRQVSDFPYEEACRLVVNPHIEGTEFPIGIRRPLWVGNMRLEVNGKQLPIKVDKGYITVSQPWHKGDTITLSLPMSLRAEDLPDHSGNYSIMYGPLVLAAKIGSERMDGMFADASRGGHIAAGPKLPLYDMPVIIDDGSPITKHVEAVEGKKLTFRLTGVRPEKYENIELTPFNSIHECRYAVYFPVKTESVWQKEIDDIRAKEQAQAAIDAVTIDGVVCGEQQPESDHFIDMKDSGTGSDNDRHWRKATGFFAYTISTAGRVPKKVRIEYLPQKDCDATISIDGKTIGTLKPGDGTAKEPIVTDIALKGNVKDKGKMVLRIAPDKAVSTPRVYQVSLLSE